MHPSSSFLTFQHNLTILGHLVKMYICPLLCQSSNYKSVVKEIGIYIGVVSKVVDNFNREQKTGFEEIKLRCRAC